MKIIIDYESSWRNSFLDGSNNERLPKEGRKYICSMKKLKEPKNYIKREITIDTVMGILNRLVGDQRKLYQSRKSPDYFFKDIEPLVKFKDIPKVVNNEITYIRNIMDRTDQNSYTGLINTDDPIFQSDYSKEFWGVLALDLEQLLDFIISGNYIQKEIELCPLIITERLEKIDKMKAIENEGNLKLAFNKLKEKFEDYNGLNDNGLLLPKSLYFSALYMQLDRLEQKYDMSTAKTKKGCISGISKKTFTKKNFMNRYTTGEMKKVWGNPYIKESLVKGEGKTQYLMTKVSGQLEITIDVGRDQSKKLDQIIKNAGVSTFYLGKKGLAYVSNIRLQEGIKYGSLY